MPLFWPHVAWLGIDKWDLVHLKDNAENVCFWLLGGRETGDECEHGVNITKDNISHSILFGAMYTWLFVSRSLTT